MWNVSGLLLKRYSLFTEKLCRVKNMFTLHVCLFLFLASLKFAGFPTHLRVSALYIVIKVLQCIKRKKNKRSNLAVAIYPRFSKYKALHAGICMHVFLRYNLSYMISILEYRNNHHHDTVISFFNNNSKPKNIHVIALCKP